MLVSSLKQTSADRITVCFDNGNEISSTLAVVTDMRLYSGRVLDDDEFEHLRLASLRSLARDRALEIISRRQMSRLELLQKLRDKGFDDDTAQYCVQWLEDNRFLDDERYACAVVRHYAAKGYGEGRIRAELSRRGIDRELWGTALDALPEDTSKIDRFVSSHLTDPNDREQIRKLSAALFRRGFSWDEIKKALSRCNAEFEEY